MSDSRCQIRFATAGDADAVADLAAELALSFTFSRSGFDRSYPALLAAPFCRALGYAESAVYFRKVLEDQ